MTSPSLKPEDIDKVGLTVLNLAQELWTLMERQHLLDNALEKKGISVIDLIDTKEPHGELADTLQKERQRFIERIVNSLSTET